MRNAKSHRQIAVEHSDARRRAIGLHLPSGALNEDAEGDLPPMVLEEIAEKLLEARRVCGQREHVERRSIGLDHSCRRIFGNL
jgi:hypothetical protein